ncbi:MAG: hypothetical protein E7391_08750 [Ruminococcaceae bacterium]|nr:hypothetical protein [Oscillospiraceae bacterium]
MKKLLSSLVILTLIISSFSCVAFAEKNWIVPLEDFSTEPNPAVITSNNPSLSNDINNGWMIFRNKGSETEQWHEDGQYYELNNTKQSNLGYAPFDSKGVYKFTEADGKQYLVFKILVKNPKTERVSVTGTPGDHDTNYAMKEESPNHLVEQAWAKHFNMPRVEGASLGKSYYSVDYKDIHIAVIDTTMLAPDASSDDEQIKWLKEDMKNTDKKWKIAITHESPQAPHSKTLTTSTTTTAYKLRKTLMTLATECGIDLFISGDRHLYSRTYPIYGLGGVLDETTGAVTPFETETGLGNPDATIVKTEEINGKTTKFYDALEGVTYVTVGSVATNAGGYSADALDSTKVLIPSYDVLNIELENFDSADLANYSTYQTVTVSGDDLIISVYHYDLSNHEAGGTLYDQFGLTKK